MSAVSSIGKPRRSSVVRDDKLRTRKKNKNPDVNSDGGSSPAKRTFPKKGVTSSLKKEKIVVGRPKSAFKNFVPLSGGKSRPGRTAVGMKEEKSKKIKSLKKKTRTVKGVPVKGTSVEYDQLAGDMDDDGSDGHLDVSDMLSDGGDISGEENPMETDQKAAKRSALLYGNLSDQSDDDIEASDDEIPMVNSHEAKIDPKAANRAALLQGDLSDNESPNEFDDDDDNFDMNVEPQNDAFDNEDVNNEFVVASHPVDSHAESVDDEYTESVDGEVISKQFREEMANMPMSKVREMKEKLGIKLFNKAYFGTTEETKQRGEDAKEHKEKQRLKHEKRHKNRPKEVSSKIRVSTFRNLYPEERLEKKRWDPRFDERAGEFKEWCHDDNYGFVEEIKKTEKAELKKHLAECKQTGDQDKAETINQVLRTMEDRDRTVKERRLKQAAMKDIREENINRMMQGQAPKFKTKAQVREKYMEKKFEQLKSERKLDKYIQRKNKQEVQKSKKARPFEKEYGYQ